MTKRHRIGAAGAAFFAAIAAAPGSGAAEAPAPRPILLVEQPSDRGLELKVVGASEAPFAGSYRLEVTSGTAGNRSIQSGRARLEPGVPVTLVRLHVGNAPAKGWSALLKVVPEQGEPYEIALNAAAR
ncbi:curli-like amyloid fiber formation chaperone CsgH [Sphingosinicella sp. BN140058]|uniref:curli-like amyloid fiber formation chaperone CsgH n=1 Tax=Sphingosinicella sp. BN140058 TaxID=1892855 RepID=UPI0010124723|nr:curli-like amyloid fiber formation chaperone CsgH [Sphingosinicella sp. BN140058]QAY79207.1 hypothetical protein ETR14_23700 [Sphingosinicella sp. BN140058]